MTNPVQAWVTRVLSRCEPEPGSECIRWIGCIDGGNGYGKCYVPPAFEGIAAKCTGAHRVLYTLLRGPIPEGHHVDHIRCPRWCVNVFHLQTISARENCQLANEIRWHGGRDEDWQIAEGYEGEW